MKKYLRPGITTLMLTFLAMTISYAAEESIPKPAPAPATAAPSAEVGKTNGEVLKIEGQSYLIKDASGNQTLLTLDKDTRLEGAPKVGDKIEVELSSDGRLISLKVTQ
jgi:hypothetical protein